MVTPDMKYLKKFATVTVALALSSCASVGPKPVLLYSRPDIKSTTDKVIIFPPVDFQGNRSEGAKEITMQVQGGWAEMYGAANVIPVGPLLDQLKSLTSPFYSKLVKSLDNTSAIEQLHKDKQVRDFIGHVTENFGQHNFALALVMGDAHSYDAQQEVRLHLGFFDVRNLTWKWITKVVDKKGIVGNWKTSSAMMVSKSFDFAKKLKSEDQGAVVATSDSAANPGPLAPPTDQNLEGRAATIL